MKIIAALLPELALSQKTGDDTIKSVDHLRFALFLLFFNLINMIKTLAYFLNNFLLQLC